MGARMGTQRGTLGLPTVINRCSIGYSAGTSGYSAGTQGKAHPKAVKPIVSSVASFSVENMFTASPSPSAWLGGGRPARAPRRSCREPVGPDSGGELMPLTVANHAGLAYHPPEVLPVQRLRHEASMHFPFLVHEQHQRFAP
jgi:hypothetical protein